MSRATTKRQTRSEDQATAQRAAKKRGRATINDVALASGFSIGTVSRVLNNRGEVSAATRARIKEAIALLGYEPDHVARTLSRKQLSVGLSLAAGARRLTPFFMVFIERLIEELQLDGYRFTELAADAPADAGELPDAIIVHGALDDDARIAQFQRQRVPFVVVGHAKGVRWVAPDDHAGGHMATQHLTNLGHEKIIHLGGLMSQQAFQDRYSGYLSALAEAGLPEQRNLLLDGEFTTLGGYRAVRGKFEAGCTATAIFAASDEMAVGAIAALHDLGYRVPLDVSVVGFDDLPEVAHGLTTVRQNIGTIATTAVTLLKEALAGDPVRNVTVPVQLVARGTTARRRE